MACPEIDEGKTYIGYRDALALVYANISTLDITTLDIAECAGYVLAEDVVARVSSPTDDISLKDGFAVRAADIAGASLEKPARLKVLGSAFAGHRFEGVLTPGGAVKIMSGSPVPAGADAVVASELCYEASGEVQISANTREEQNIFPGGGDIKAGETVAQKGQVLMPGRLSLIAAAGISKAKVYRKPEVALIGIGDEVVAPGEKLKDGQLYASNLVNLGAWLACFGLSSRSALALDNRDSIKQVLQRCLPGSDVIATSGGAWGSEKDLVVGALNELGWRKIFHHVRLGPGKGVAFGLWQGKPVFCLPGGPPSNQMAFLQLALPGIMRMAGHSGQPLPSVSAILTQDIKRRNLNWTEFRSGKLSRDEDGNKVTPFSLTSRLKSMADSTCLICIPEGVEAMNRGQKVNVQLLVPDWVTDAL